MKHLKNFSLFESKSHKLPLPKDLYNKTDDLIKGGSLLRRFGV